MKLSARNGHGVPGVDTLAPVGTGAPVSIEELAGSVAAARSRHPTAVDSAVTLVSADGPLADVATHLHRSVLLALGQQSRGVICDLTGVDNANDPAPLAILASVAQHVRDWPAVPIAVVCPDGAARETLRGLPSAEHLVVRASLDQAMSVIGRWRPPTTARLRLERDPQSSRLARMFVGRRCLRWELGYSVDAAVLVASEIVTNRLLNGCTDMEVSLAHSGDRLRVAVRDCGTESVLYTEPDIAVDPDRRGLFVVKACSRAWGMLPARNGGVVLWAVLDA